MKRRDWLGGVCLIVLATTCGVAMAAASDDLQRAVDLYNTHNYVQARNLLVKISPADLTDAQRAIRTDYLNRTLPTIPQPANIDQVMTFTPAAKPAPAPSASLSTAPPLVTYPSNWAQVVRRAQRYGAAQRTEDEPTRLTRLKFSQIVPEISFAPGTTFNDAIERIADASGLNIYVNWPTLEQAGVSKDQEVTLPHLRNLSWRKVLDLLLQQVSARLGGVTQLDWAIDAGVLTISTRDELNTHLTLRVYDIGDLLMPPLVVAPTGGFQVGTGTTGTGTTGTSGSGTSIGTGTIGGGLGTTP